MDKWALSQGRGRPASPHREASANIFHIVTQVKSDTVNKKGFLFTVSGRSEASAIATARRSGGRLYIMIGDHGVSIATSTAMVWRRRAREISWCMGVWQPTILPRTLAVHNYFFTFFTVGDPNRLMRETERADRERQAEKRKMKFLQTQAFA